LKTSLFTWRGWLAENARLREALEAENERLQFDKKHLQERCAMYREEREAARDEVGRLNRQLVELSNTSWNKRMKESKMGDQKPTVGRIVHYQSLGSPAPNPGDINLASAARAAVITDVSNTADGVVCLFVMNPMGQHVVFDVPYSHDPKRGCWSWPPRD
jgi:hypothetical protein